MHHCLICHTIEECQDEIDPGTCDFRELFQAHGYCIAKLTPKEQKKFFG